MRLIVRIASEIHCGSRAPRQGNDVSLVHVIANKPGHALLGRLAVKMLMIGAGIRAGLVNRAVEMFGRAVDGIEPERHLAGADHIVARALRHDDSIVRLDLVADTIDPDLPFAALDTEELVPVVVDFLTNFVTRLNRHEDKLQVMPGIQHAAEIVVVFRQLFDVVDETLHPACSCHVNSLLSILMRARMSPGLG
jgi:hypothetical protein